MNRSATPWVVFAGHRPYYIDSTNNRPDGDQQNAAALRASFEELLHGHSKDVPIINFGAHHHSYQRSCLSGVYKNACLPAKGATNRGVVVVDLGMAGAGNSNNLVTPQPAIWEVVDAKHHGYTRVRADFTSFHVEYVRGGDREVADSFTLRVSSSTGATTG